MLLILAIGIISIAIGLVLGMQENLVEFFNISPFSVDALKDFLDQYLAGLPYPPEITT